MPVPKVWTERNTGSVGWTDCTWCSVLMVVVGSGYTAFPGGIYTEVERKAFRGGDARLNFAGGIEHAKSRYGVTVVSPAPMSMAQLGAALSAPNRVWAIAGKLANFPNGHRLRRWQPSFLDFHAVCVASDASAHLTWLDPLAPNLSDGEGVTIAEVQQFGLSNYPNDARYMALGGDMPAATKNAGPPIGTFKFGPVPHALIATWDTKVHYPQPAGAGPFSVIAALDLKAPNKDPAVAVDIEGHSPPLNNRDQVYLVQEMTGVGFVFGNAAYALRQDGTFTPTPAGGHTDAELAAAVKAASTKGYNEGRGAVQGAAAAVPPKS